MFRTARDVLIAPLDGVGRDYPVVDREALSRPVVLCGQRLAGGMRAVQANPSLRWHGPHHVHSFAERADVILEFGLKKPAFRIVVNTPTTHGSIGLTTGLDPAMTLGCGGYGGNITSDNISPRHLLNIKRLAYEIAPVANRFEGAGSAVAARAPSEVATAGITAAALSRRIEDFLGSPRLSTSGHTREGWHRFR